MKLECYCYLYIDGFAPEPYSSILLNVYERQKKMIEIPSQVNVMCNCDWSHFKQIYDVWICV